MNTFYKFKRVIAGPANGHIAQKRRNQAISTNRRKSSLPFKNYTVGHPILGFTSDKGNNKILNASPKKRQIISYGTSKDIRNSTSSTGAGISGSRLSQTQVSPKDPDTRRSTNGGIILRFGAPILRAPSLQSFTALSTVESELL